MVRRDVSLFLQMRLLKPQVVNDLPKVTQQVRNRARFLAVVLLRCLSASLVAPIKVRRTGLMDERVCMRARARACIHAHETVNLGTPECVYLCVCVCRHVGPPTPSKSLPRELQVHAAGWLARVRTTPRSSLHPTPALGLPSVGRSCTWLAR